MSAAAPELATLDRVGVGRFGARWALCAAALLALFACGAAAWLHEASRGLVATGQRTIGQGGAVWGIYLVFYFHFAGLSFAGIAAAAFARLFRVRDLEPMTRLAVLLAIVSLLVATLFIVVDLGRPAQGLLYLPRYGRPSSPFFGTFTVVDTGYLFASLVYLFLAGRADAAACAERFPAFRWAYGIWAAGWRGTHAEKARRARASFWLSLCILPLLVVAQSTLGLVFGIQGGRPGWFSPLQAPSFLVLGAVSGTATLIAAGALVRRALRIESLLTERSFRVLGNFLWPLSFAQLYLMGIEQLTASYAASEAQARVAREIAFGAYAGAFWTAVACFAAGAGIPFLAFVRRTASVGWLVAASILVSVGSVLQRVLTIVPSQTHGMLLPYRTGSYAPTLGEWTVVVGLCALGALLLLLFAKLFPIVPVVRDVPEAPRARSAEGVLRKPLGPRAAIFWTTLGAGLALAVTGFLLSLRVGTLPYLDPVVPGSPLLFAFGVMLCFYSAAAYETLPPARK